MKKTILFFLPFLYINNYHSACAANIVQTDHVYTYENLTNDLYELANTYPNIIQLTALTETDYGRKIWAVKLGNGETSVLLNGAHHAREWMTSMLLMKMIETYAEAHKTNTPISGLSPAILDDVSLWFVPMVNPDGVTLQQFGLEAVPFFAHEQFLQMNKGIENFNRWKANGDGIDLNRQYPVGWEQLKGVTSSPSYKMFKGTRPLQAKEAQALVHLTKNIQPEIAVSYHSSGQVIFWGIDAWRLTHTTDAAEREHSIVDKLSAVTHYKLAQPGPTEQGGGYTDWFASSFQKPAFTLEIGELVEEQSLPLSAFPEVWKRNHLIGLIIAEQALHLQNMKKAAPSPRPSMK
ncbi:M14 family zinc carboxypeptidase [Bacillus taeanensis]|nr:M14 family zinc carboxypeptidase [Bacillus taeanensis]